MQIAVLGKSLAGSYLQALMIPNAVDVIVPPSTVAEEADIYPVSEDEGVIDAYNTLIMNWCEYPPYLYF